MTLAIVVIAFVLCATVIFFFAVRSRRRRAVQRSVDIKAFRALMDRDDENFLRMKLSRNVFFHLKRQRIRVAWGYVARMSGNAEGVLRWFGGARSHVNSDTQVVERAIELASQIRMHCLVSYAKLAVEFVFPSLQLTPTLLESKYESLRDTVAQLTSFQPQNEAPAAIAI